MRPRRRRCRVRRRTPPRRNPARRRPGPPDTISPQSVPGGCTPSPMNEIAARSTMAYPNTIVAWATIIGSTFGTRWRTQMATDGWPCTESAAMYGCDRSRSAAARTTRAMYGRVGDGQRQRGGRQARAEDGGDEHREQDAGEREQDVEHRRDRRVDDAAAPGGDDRQHGADDDRQHDDDQRAEQRRPGTHQQARERCRGPGCRGRASDRSWSRGRRRRG